MTRKVFDITGRKIREEVGQDNFCRLLDVGLELSEVSKAARHVLVNIILDKAYESREEEFESLINILALRIVDHPIGSKEMLKQTLENLMMVTDQRIKMS